MKDRRIKKIFINSLRMKQLDQYQQTGLEVFGIRDKERRERE